MWPSLFCLWLALSGKAPQRRAPRRRPALHQPPFRPRLEDLEGRCLPSSYSITPIGAIYSGQGTLPGVMGPVSGINNASVVQVAGEAANDHAYLWDSVHGMQDLGTLNLGTGGEHTISYSYSSAIDVNNAGQVVGRSETITQSTKYDKKIGGYPSTSTQAGFRWTSSSGMTSLANNTGPAAINSSGEIAGNAGSPAEASLFTGNTVVPLGILPGATFSVAFGMNDDGQVVGYSQIVNNRENLPHAFLWTPSSPNSSSGSMIDLGEFMSPGDSSAVAINGQGWVTGNSSVPLSQPIGDVIGVGHAFLWKPTSTNGTSGTMIDLGTLDPNADGGLGQSQGLAINRSGVVVGQSNPTGATSQNQTDAVIWQPGSTGSYTLSDLNSLIPSGTGWTLWRADAINDSGQIVAEATNSSLSGWYALLLTPSTPAAPARRAIHTRTSAADGSLLAAADPLHPAVAGSAVMVSTQAALPTISTPGSRLSFGPFSPEVGGLLPSARDAGSSHTVSRTATRRVLDQLDADRDSPFGDPLDVDLVVAQLRQR
jgi:probable HAF family extracellular repeat protein